MSYEVGQSINGIVAFPNGELPKVNRFYLIIEVLQSGVNVLHVSSTQGKEHKLLYDDSYDLQIHNPPFPRPTFVKLDSKTFVSFDQLNNCRVTCRGECLNFADISNIMQRLNTLSPIY